MEVTIKHATVNAWVGEGWYSRGQERLQRSLIHHGDTSDHLFFQDEWPKSGYNQQNPYCVKASCMEMAVEMGYKRLLWLDCSVWAIKYTMPIWDEINEKGYYFWKSGFNCAQVCSDRCLDYFGVHRDLAETWLDVSTSMFGINLDNPAGQEFLERWIRAAKNGIFDGSRYHDNQSSDPRFLFARQDQQVASVIVNQMGLEIKDAAYFSEIYTDKPSETTIFLMQGI